MPRTQSDPPFRGVAPSTVRVLHAMAAIAAAVALVAGALIGFSEGVASHAGAPFTIGLTVGGAMIGGGLGYFAAELLRRLLPLKPAGQSPAQPLLARDRWSLQLIPPVIVVLGMLVIAASWVGWLLMFAILAGGLWLARWMQTHAKQPMKGWLGFVGYAWAALGALSMAGGIGFVASLVATLVVASREPGFAQGAACAFPSDPPAERIEVCSKILNDAAVGLSGDGRAAVLVSRADAFSRLRNHAAAIADLTEAAKLDPTDYNVHEELGEAYQAAEKFPASIDAYQKLFKILPSATASIAFRCQDRAKIPETLDLAWADCTAVLRFDPHNVDALDGRGLVELKRGRFQEAWNDFNAAAAKQPRNADHLFGRGLALIGLGRVGEGQADITAARERDRHVAERFAEYELGR